MNRNTRTLLVLVVAVIVAGLATLGVYRAVQRMPVREVEVAHTYVLVAARPLAMGARLTAADVKVVPWPSRTPVAGSLIVWAATAQTLKQGRLLCCSVA